MSEKKIAECTECHRHMPIVARGLCGKCYRLGRVGKIEMPPSKRKERKPKVQRAKKARKKRGTKAGYFETFGARVDELVRGIETKDHEIETLQKQQSDMRLQLLKSRHEILQEIDKRAVEKALKIAGNMSDDGNGKGKKADA